MNVDLLKTLGEAAGIPGREDAIRDIVINEMKGGLADDISVDVMGSVHGVKKGSSGKRKVMLAAHMDEIGFAVRHITDKGFLKISPLGGWDPRMMAAQRVKVRTRSGELLGVMMPGTKPKHLLSDADMKMGWTTDDFFVDCGLSGDEAKEKVSIGDMVTMDRGLQQMGDLLTCKAMDDRVAVFVMLEALRKAKPDADVHAVATVQEEIGLRGAAAAGSAIAPDICIALDVTLANDFPGMPDDQAVTRLGQGAAIKVQDSSLICHPKLVEHFRDIAEREGINHQLELLPRGGTDAGGVQRLHGGIHSFTLSIPCRYIHTVNETVHRNDVQACIDLLAAFMGEAESRDYSYM